MDNEKDKPNTINDLNQPQIQGVKSIVSENDSIEVNNLLSLADSDITPDLLMQLEQRAKAEQDKMNFLEPKEDKSLLQEDIQIPEGLPAENGAVNVTGEIMERPKTPEDTTPAPPPKAPEQSMDPLEEAKMNAVYKKYVIYIDKDNENYIDSLTLGERKQLINDVLHEQRELSEAQRAEKRRKEAFIKLLLGLVTFIIAVPIIYLI